MGWAVSFDHALTAAQTWSALDHRLVKLWLRYSHVLDPADYLLGYAVSVDELVRFLRQCKPASYRERSVRTTERFRNPFSACAERHKWFSLELSPAKILGCC